MREHSLNELMKCNHDANHKGLRYFVVDAKGGALPVMALVNAQEKLPLKVQTGQKRHSAVSSCTGNQALCGGSRLGEA